MSYEGTTGKAGEYPCCKHCQHPQQLPRLLHERPCPRCPHGECEAKRKGSGDEQAERER